MSSHNKGKDHEHAGPKAVPSGPNKPGSEEEFDLGSLDGTSQAVDPPSSAPLAEQVQQLLGEKQELMNMMVRRQADFENYRKRVEKERHQDRHRGVELLIEHILPVIDAFDRALAGQKDHAATEYLKGFEMIRRQLWDALAKQGLSRIESSGKEFNPHFHHAIEQVPTSEVNEGIVIDEMQPGYLFQDRVLRPAMVRVATHPEPKTASAARTDN